MTYIIRSTGEDTFLWLARLYAMASVPIAVSAYVWQVCGVIVLGIYTHLFRS